MATPARVLVVGLGTIAQTHLEVLRTRHDVAVVAGVDPRGPGEQDLPTYASVGAAVEAAVRADIAVVATPTDTHLDLVSELLGTTTAHVLCEKPLARDSASLDALADQYPSDVLSSRLSVAHHFAFSPEVEWARALVAGTPRWGKPTRVTCAFNDAYALFPPERQAVYVSSWVDSGPNQLSVLAAFEPHWQVRSHRDLVQQSVTVLDLPGGTAHLVSNWAAADTSKQTHVEYLGGEVEVRLDHTSMTVLVRESDAITTHTAYAGRVGRKHAHYRGVYDSLLTDPGDPRLGLTLAVRITRTLEEAGTAPEPALTTADVT